MARHTREDWAKRIERWKESGLTAAEFAAETGINAHSLSWWQWKLSTDAKTGASSTAAPSEARVSEHEHETRRRRRRRSKPSDGPSPPTMTFVEVTPSPRSGALEVKLASGREIRVPVGFDAPTLERLVAILERRA